MFEILSPAPDLFELSESKCPARYFWFVLVRQSVQAGEPSTGYISCGVFMEHETQPDKRTAIPSLFTKNCFPLDSSG